MPSEKEMRSMERMVEFLERNVVGKTVYSEETLYDLDFGRYEGAYSTEVSFSNLLQTETGFTMDGFTGSHEKIVETGRLRALVKDQCLVSFFKYEFSKRTSSGEITGILRFVSSSAALNPSPAEATASSIFDVTMRDDEFRWMEDQVLYRDQQNTDKSFSPKAFVSENYLRMRDGKLEYGFSAECYTVNPKTLERKRAYEYYSPFVAKEK
ncbi:MAG: hypothetical protein FWH47_03790 [Methanomassiliicoccaceae archaeon]|nr:hypothetical protein [Methanomassiliicoccaceae archaeon]